MTLTKFTLKNKNVIKILKSKSCLESIADLNIWQKDGLAFLQSYTKSVEKLRVQGTIAAFDVKANNTQLKELKRKFLQDGLLLRPLQNSVYLLPPYCISQKEIEEAYKKIGTILKAYLE